MLEAVDHHYGNNGDKDLEKKMLRELQALRAENVNQAIKYSYQA